MMDYRKEAALILEAIGGKENVSAVAHCATRLRLVLNDESVVDEKQLEGLDVVKGTFSTGGQYQIIIGQGTVNKVYAEFSQLTGIGDMSTTDVKSAGAKKMNPLQQFVKMLSDIFVPIIPAIVAGGLLMGINNLLTAPDLFFEGRSLIDQYPGMADIAAMINTFANAAFVFLPVLIGFSAAKRFGGNPYLGAALGMIMVHPDLINAYAQASVDEIPVWNVFGLEIEKLGYQGQVLPVLVAAYILSKIEINIRKFMPASLDILLTPLLSLLVTAFITFAFVGPVTREAGNLIIDGLIWTYDSLGFVGGLVMGLLYAPIVITGMHHSFIAIETQLLADIAKTGGTFIFPIAAMSNVAQGAATLAVFFLTRDKKMKGVASASGISALLGITEPAMFGVNLKLRYPFIAAIVGSAVASAFIVGNDVLAVALGAAGLPGIISIGTGSIVSYVIGMLLSFAVAFGLTFVLAKRHKKKDSVKQAA